jgi:DnaK suppressor protein
MKHKKSKSQAVSKAASKPSAKRSGTKATRQRPKAEVAVKRSHDSATERPTASISVKARRSTGAAGHANGSNSHGSVNGKNGASNGRHAMANGNAAPAAKSADTILRGKGTQRAIRLPANYQPSDSEPFMGARQQLYFRLRLQNWRDEIVRQARQTLQALTEESAQHADLADRATSESDKALELRARDRQRKLIAKIDAALERLDNGTYGYCEETGEPIGLRRLEARPIATLSIEAQERHERLERVHRDD